MKISPVPSVPSQRHLTPAAARILEAASKLFYWEGIHAVGVEAIAAAAGVTKKTLYDQFGSKDALVAAYLEARDQRWRDRLVAQVDAAEPDPVARLLTAFDALGEWMRTENPRGCGFVNAYAELTDPDHPGRKVAQAQKAWLLEYLAALAEEAGADDPTDIAQQLLILHEGATVAFSIGNMPGAAGMARDVAARLVANL